jgi:hypothetical protein
MNKFTLRCQFDHQLPNLYYQFFMEINQFITYADCIPGNKKKNNINVIT